jgi:hypothetical protein
MMETTLYDAVTEIASEIQALPPHHDVIPIRAV